VNYAIDTNKMINVIWPRPLKNAYRKEPISAFILTVGAVDAVIGGVGQRWSLLSVGITLVAGAALMRWLQIEKSKAIAIEEKPRYYLPPSSSRTPLPMLTNKKNQR
jgi:hypothetical protein